MICLNNRAFKICMTVLPNFMSHRVIKFNKHLAKIKMEPFIWFDGDFVRLNLDKPSHIIPALTD